jgi:hypothetical protein
MISRIAGDSALGRGTYAEVSPAGGESTQSLVSFWHYLDATIADHPKKSLLAALSTGVLLGWFIKRR